MHPGSTGTTASRLDIKASMALAQRPSGLSTTTRPLHARNTARCGAGGAGAPAARGKVPAARRALILASSAHRAPQAHPGVNRGPTRASTGRGGTARATVTQKSRPQAAAARPQRHSTKQRLRRRGWAGRKPGPVAGADHGALGAARPGCDRCDARRARRGDAARAQGAPAARPHPAARSGGQTLRIVVASPRAHRRACAPLGRVRAHACPQ